MNNLKLTLLTLMAATASTHCAEIYLNTINNKTLHKIQWEKLPLPGLLGKMRPETISRFGSAQPNMPIIPPATFSFKNPNRPSQAVLIELKLIRTLLKRRPRKGEDPKKYVVTKLVITLKDTEGNELERWAQRVNDTFSYQIRIDIKGLDLRKTDVEIMKYEIPEAQKINTLRKIFNIKPIKKESR